MTLSVAGDKAGLPFEAAVANGRFEDRDKVLDARSTLSRKCPGKYLMRAISRSALFLLVAGVIALRAVPAEAAVANGGFEDRGRGLSGWTLVSSRSDAPPDRRAKGEATAEIAPEAHSGKHSLHIRWEMPEQDSWDSLWTLTNSARLAVKPGEVFTVTAWLKGTSGFRCGKVWMEVMGLADGKVVARGIGKDMCNARSTWQQFEAVARVPAGCEEIQVRFRGGHNTDLFLDDVEVRAGSPPPRAKVSKPRVRGFARERIEENLDRGIVAVPIEGKRVYVGWRLLETDSQDTAFNVYRRSGKGVPVRLNAQPLRTTTDFVDVNLPAGGPEGGSEGESEYFVRRVVDGKEESASRAARATPSARGQPYIAINLAGDYAANKVGIGDLDGDGCYEYVIKQPDVSFDPWIGSRAVWRASPDTYKLEAYRQDGTLLWRHDMGWSIETGVWFSPFVVYDLDGDGCAEVAVKAGQGDPRDAERRVWTGPEYLMILDGKTGKEKARVDWPPREGYVTHEALNRNQICVAYLDGKTPCVIAERGTYDTIVLVAYEFHAGNLRELWRWHDREEKDLLYTGQGAHCVHAADVDGDGRDEVIIGAAVIDDNGMGLWTTGDTVVPSGSVYGWSSGSGHGHPDHCAVGDLDPTRPGLEINYCHEKAMPENGICQVDAKTGRILWTLREATEHAHTGLSADLDPRYPGAECWGWDPQLEKGWLFSAQGDKLPPKERLGTCAAYWDADTQRETWHRQSGRLMDYATGRECEPAIDGKLIAVADVLGDWREEVIACVPGELRIYTTTIPAADRRVCLMRDPIYRMDVCEESQGYLTMPGLRVLPGTEKDGRHRE